VAVLKNLGTRLTQAERAPYEMPEHDDVVNFDDPTGEIIPRDPSLEKKPS
jgi:hypothetical protein